MRIKGKSDKKGISLIVLVITIIVIIILAVAVILSIANNNPIENAKEARIKNDLKTIEEELTLKQASSYVDEHANNKTPSEITIDDLASAANYKDKLTIKDGKLCVTNKASEEIRKAATDLGIKTEDPITFTKQGELALGSEVTASNGEPFYVIGGDAVGTPISADTQTVILLAKYNLTSDGKSQDTSGASNECAFSSTNYWSSVEGIAYPDTDGNYPDLNDVEKYSIGSATSIITTAKAYGESLGVTGRLMTYAEALALKTNYSNILYGTNTGKGYLNYWLGSADSEDIVWHADGRCSFISEDSGYSDVSTSGVRPVIKVSKSLIQ